MPALPVPVDNPIIPRTSLAEALAAVREEPAPALTSEELLKHPKAQEIYEFTVEIVGGDGVKRGGTFKNRILGAEEKGMVGLLIAKLTKGVPWNVLDPDTQYLYLMLAQLSLSLVAMPKDFSLATEKNMALIEAVYGEVTAHEAHFRGPPPAPPAGAR